MNNLFKEYLESAQKLAERCEVLRQELNKPHTYEERKSLRARITALENERLELLRDAFEMNFYLKEKKDLHFTK